MKESKQSKIKNHIECTTYQDRFSSIEPLAKFWDFNYYSYKTINNSDVSSISFLKNKKIKRNILLVYNYNIFLDFTRIFFF